MVKAGFYAGDTLVVSRTFDDLGSVPNGWKLIESQPLPPHAGPSEGEDRKAVMTADVNARRDALIDGGITFGGLVYQSDPVSRARIDRARISALAAIMGGAQAGDLQWHGEPVDFVWIAADDTRTAMDAQTVVAFGSAVAAREGLLIVYANDLKQAIAGAADDGALDAIDIETGWP